MNVEVNEQNIIKFGLVQLTGNSVEVLLTRAKEARESGYILTVELPDDQIPVNVFDVAPGGRPSDADLRHREQASNPIMNRERDAAHPERKIDVEVVSVVEDSDEAIDGEIMEE
jgi:hypothetical protein